jgi:hypothetical protein
MAARTWERATPITPQELDRKYILLRTHGTRDITSFTCYFRPSDETLHRFLNGRIYPLKVASDGRCSVHCGAGNIKLTPSVVAEKIQQYARPKGSKRSKPINFDSYLSSSSSDDDIPPSPPSPPPPDLIDLAQPPPLPLPIVNYRPVLQTYIQQLRQLADYLEQQSLLLPE